MVKAYLKPNSVATFADSIGLVTINIMNGKKLSFSVLYDTTPDASSIKLDHFLAHRNFIKSNEARKIRG
jgi:hypothetical protein